MEMDDRLTDKQANNSSIRWSQLISQLSNSVFSGVVKAQQATKDQKNFPLMTKKQNVFPPSLSRAESFIVNDAQNMNHTVGWTALLSPSQRGLLVVCFSTISTKKIICRPPELQQISLWKVHQWTHPTQSHKQNHHIFSANNSKISRNECFF